MALRRFPVALGMASGLLAGAFAGADTPIPAAVTVSGDFQLVLTTHAKGDQIYTCAAGKDNPAQLGWVLKAPEAVLFDKQGKPIGKHFGGPSWELDDGSLVTGEVVGKDPGPVADAVPWLLLKVKTNSGKGVLAQAIAIQRIETADGLAPKTRCSAGEESRSPYSATYRFFAEKR